jgi:hypothetical protein
VSIPENNYSDIHNRDRAHTGGIHEEARLEAFMDMFGRAMRVCGVDQDAPMTMKERAELILSRAEAVGLDKKLYKLACFVKKTAR